MKRVFRQMLGCCLMLVLPLMMTSCEWFWDIVDNPVTPGVYVAKVNVTMKVGESLPLRAATQPHVELLYVSANPAVATVDAEGVVTAIAEGTTTITIKAQGEDEYYRTEIFGENTKTVEVTVIPAKAAGSISFAAPSVIKYKNDELLPNPLTIVGDGVATYESSNEEVATVDATTGEVTIIGFGSTNITATVTDGAEYAYKTKTVSYTLTVDPAINLAALSGNYIAQNGDVLTGTLAGNYKISIAAGASVELKDVTINGVNDEAYRWAGLTCLYDANITITGTNSVNGFHFTYPGIQAGPAGTTLTINGTGSLTATGGDFAAGIGSGFNVSSCGHITISGGTVNASSSLNGAGIGSGYADSSCGDITISGGTVNASSSWNGAGIGSGYAESSCGNITISGGTVNASSSWNGAGIGSGVNSTFGSITITAGITQVQATRNDSNAWPIGKGFSDNDSGAVTINGVTVTSKDWDGTGLTDLNFATSSTGSNNLTWTLTPKVP